MTYGTVTIDTADAIGAALAFEERADKNAELAKRLIGHGNRELATDMTRYALEDRARAARIRRALEVRL